MPRPSHTQTEIRDDEDEGQRDRERQAGRVPHHHAPSPNGMPPPLPSAQAACLGNFRGDPRQQFAHIKALGGEGSKRSLRDFPICMFWDFHLRN